MGDKWTKGRNACAALAFATGLASSACYGIIDGTAPESSSAPGVDGFARLSHAQWALTVQDLFGPEATAELSSTLAADALGRTAFDNDASGLDVGRSLFTDYQQAAETIAERVTSQPESLARLLAATPAAEPGPRARAFLQSLGLRAFRRPLTSAELDARQALFGQGAALYPALEPFAAGVRLSIAAFLQSPHFLYRVEKGQPPAAGGAAPLDGWQVASRLSYALWSSLPDDELFRAAEAGELLLPTGIHAQVERMLQSPRASAVVARFFDQLYQGREYEHLTKSPALYPMFGPELGADMRGELTRFTQNVYDEGGGLRELLTSTTTFVTPRLAAIYGIPASNLPPPDAAGFSRAQLAPQERAGLLTLSGFLAWKASDTQPGTIGRGVFVTRKIVCQPLGDPPAAAQGAALGGGLTNRQRVEGLTGAGTCGAGCHGRYINPLGFAFEHFGALGEYRATEAGNPIDAAAAFPFEGGSVSYRDAPELSQALAESPQVHACFTGYLFEYLAGRKAASSDAALLAQLAQSSLAGASTEKLLASIVESEAVRPPLAEVAP